MKKERKNYLQNGCDAEEKQRNKPLCCKRSFVEIDCTGNDIKVVRKCTVPVYCWMGERSFHTFPCISMAHEWSTHPCFVHVCVCACVHVFACMCECMCVWERKKKLLLYTLLWTCYYFMHHTTITCHLAQGNLLVMEAPPKKKKKRERKKPIVEREEL